jgi:hypothetical protein
MRVLIHGRDVALSFDPVNPERLACLLHLQDEPEMRVRIRQAAARQSQRHDWDETARTVWDASSRWVPERTL